MMTRPLNVRPSVRCSPCARPWASAAATDGCPTSSLAEGSRGHDEHEACRLRTAGERFGTLSCKHSPRASARRRGESALFLCACDSWRTFPTCLSFDACASRMLHVGHSREPSGTGYADTHRRSGAARLAASTRAYSPRPAACGRTGNRSLAASPASAAPAASLAKGTPRAA
jgi:hypothetical protein